MDFIEACLRGVQTVRDRAPINTGNLRYNAVNYEQRDENTFVIYVDYYDAKSKSGIAWYMPYTNEPWVSPKWKGKKNPNEGWWKDAAGKVAQEIADALGGEIL